MKLIRTILFSGFLLWSFTIVAQVNSDKYQLHVKKISEVINLDGELTEEVWQTADRTSEFILTFPEDSLPATSQTVAMLTFDDQFLYIAGICYENSSKKHIVQSLRRDFIWPRNENLSIYINPFNDFTNGFTFGLTPFGVQREGLVTNGQDVSADWDNKWFSKVKNYDDRWQFEMAIPWKTIRYNDDSNEWNIIFLRKDLKNNEESTWSLVPQGYRPSSFAFSGKVIFDDPLKKAGPNIAVIPYVSSGASKDFESGESTDTDFNAGFDAKIGISSSLNLDLTVNPDFSQVEVDRQVTNLSRFEIFFPERRQFFLENQDLFGEGGFFETRPFFSRRIGIARDTAGNSLQVPIVFGARLSGKVGKNWRVGFMNMQTKSEDGARLTGVEEIAGAYDLLAQNYTVGVVQRQIFGRSNIGLVMVNRQALAYKDNEQTSSTTEYNRVVGVDYNLLSTNGRWEGDMYFHKSIDPESKDDAFASGLFLGYNTTNLNLRILANTVGSGYNAETGFVQRTDIVRFGTFNDVSFFTKERATVAQHGPGFGFTYITDTQFNRTDMDYNIGYQLRFQNTAELEVFASHNYQKLRDPFNPTGADLDESLYLQAGEEFDWNTFGVEYETDSRKVFSGELEFNYGGFYNGDRINVNGSINYRYQPFANIALSFDYNSLEFSEPFEDTEFWLFGPRIDLTFTDKLFLTTFVQYNEQSDNVNLNARFQWRYKPVSDLFLVYTDNYFPDNFNVKSRAVIFKLTYWLNM